MKALKPTQLSQLKGYSMVNGGIVVALPSFAPDQPFVARLVRPSLLRIASEGKIPNPLMESATKLFMGGVGNGKAQQPSLMDIANVIDIFVREALVEPTYEELVENGIELTDEQKSAIMSFCQEGVTALNAFRQQLKGNKSDEHERNVPGAAISPVGD